MSEVSFYGGPGEPCVVYKSIESQYESITAHLALLGELIRNRGAKGLMCALLQLCFSVGWESQLMSWCQLLKDTIGGLVESMAPKVRTALATRGGPHTI